MPERVYHWYHKLGGLLFVNFCFVIGVALAVFPWLDVVGREFLLQFQPRLAPDLAEPVLSRSGERGRAAERVHFLYRDLPAEALLR